MSALTLGDQATKFSCNALPGSFGIRYSRRPLERIGGFWITSLPSTVGPDELDR
jgi:hypothetical protein